MRRKRNYRVTGVSAAGHGGDHRPAGAEAPTPPGRSSRAMRGTAGGRCPLSRGREEDGGRPEQIYRPSGMAALPRGWGSQGVRGCASPLSPAPRREATTPGCLAAAASQRKKEKEKRAIFQRRNGDHAQRASRSHGQGQIESVAGRKSTEKESGKGRTKFLSSGKTERKRADPPVTAEWTESEGGGGGREEGGR